MNNLDTVVGAAGFGWKALHVIGSILKHLKYTMNTKLIKYKCSGKIKI